MICCTVQYNNCYNMDLICKSMLEITGSQKHLWWVIEGQTQFKDILYNTNFAATLLRKFKIAAIFAGT